MFKKLLAFAVICLLPIISFAQAEDIYSFSDSAQQQRFITLTEKFRCLVCQNETLADSNAPLAQDLRQAIAQLIRQGQSDQQVQDYLVARYGQFVLFKPVFETKTYLLWLMPFILLVSGIIALCTCLKRRSFFARQMALTPAEQKHLQNFLQKKDQDKRI